MSHQVVGLDIGHSATKITLDTKFGVERVLYPSLATPAFKITYEAEAKRAERELSKWTEKGSFSLARQPGFKLTNPLTQDCPMNGC